MRRSPEEAPEFYRDMERNIATKLRMEGQKNVTTFDNSVATNNRENGRKTMSRHLNYVATNEERNQ